MPNNPDDNALGNFLRDRRSRIDPASLGFPTTRRRTPGLRREEVALLADVSASLVHLARAGTRRRTLDRRSRPAGIGPAPHRGRAGTPLHARPESASRGRPPGTRGSGPRTAARPRFARAEPCGHPQLGLGRFGRQPGCSGHSGLREGRTWSVQHPGEILRPGPARGAATPNRLGMRRPGPWLPNSEPRPFRPASGRAPRKWSKAWPAAPLCFSDCGANSTWGITSSR